MTRSILAGVIIALAFAFALVTRSVVASQKTDSSAPAPSQLHKCERDYSDEELAAIQENGEDGYEPDDCPLLAHTLTGPEWHTFCQLGDEDWVSLPVRSGIIYQIKAESPTNYPTEPHLDLYDQGLVLAANDHYFGNDAEVWWWNDGPDRTVFVRVTELRGRADCGNSAYTLSLHSFVDKP